MYSATLSTVSNRTHTASVTKVKGGCLLLSIETISKTYDEYSYADIVLTKKQLKELLLSWT